MKTRLWTSVLLGLLLVTAACSSSGNGASNASSGAAAATGAAGTTAPATSTAPSSSAPTTSAASSTEPAQPTQTVRVTSLISDGQTYGVGMPIVLFLSPAPTDSSAFTKAVKITVDGQPADGAWYWEQPTADEVQSHTVEAHYRLASYWPANSQVHVDVPIGGLSAGKGLQYSGKLSSLDFKIGDRHVSTVDGAAKKMRITDNGKLVRTVQVSLGKAKTPTFTGVKVVMQKGEQAPGSSKLRPKGAVRMRGPGYDEIVNWSVRITRSGEYVHAAPWNSNIGRASTSNGCTNLTTSNAEWYYNFAQIGDVVTYANTGGRRMPSWDGFGDWNVSWAEWQQGGLLGQH
jgi:lipoprotein-anchoring transpeptidase ErfK/SrfK